MNIWRFIDWRGGIVVAVVVAVYYILEFSHYKEEKNRIEARKNIHENTPLKTDILKENQGPERGAPPPLKPEADTSGMTLDEFLKYIERSGETGEKGEVKIEGDKPQVLYRWTDSEGRVYIVSDESKVPKRYRKRVEVIPISGPSSADGSSYGVKKYDPKPFRKKREIEERKWENWRKRWLRVRNRVRRLTAEREAYEKNPPNCAIQQIPGLSPKFRPTCSRTWTRRLEVLEARERTAVEEEARVREEARRAGAPPGYLR